MTNNRPSAGWSFRKGLLLSYGLATLLIFALSQALVVFGVPHTSFTGLWASLSQEAVRDTSVMADVRKGQLEAWAFERRGDSMAIGENPLLQAAVQDIVQQSPSALEAEVALKRLREYLHKIQESYYGEYAKIEIIAANSGKVLVSTRQAEEGQDASRTSYFSKALNPSVEEVVAKELAAGKVSDLVFARAIHGPGGEGATALHGVLVLHTPMDRITKSLLHEGIGRSGEIVLVDQDGWLMAPLRYPLADGSVAKPLEFVVTTKPAKLAAQGVETVIEALDYRGVEVLAATRHLRLSSELAWGLIVKIDKAEVSHPIRQTMVAHALVLAGTLLAGGLVILLIATRLARPLAALSRAAAAIAAGDFTVRTVPDGSRELQELSHTFNSMADRLEHWHQDLATEVEKRTVELSAAHQALLASEARYRQIVETTDEGISVVDAEYLTIFVNPRLAAMLGYQPEEMIGRPASYFLVDEEQALHREQEALRRQGQSSRFERRFRRRDGSQLWAMVSATPILDEQGRFAGGLAMISDISEQKRMADDLRENQARLDLALRSAGMGVFSTETDTNLRTFDDQACRLFGLDPQTFSGSAEEFFRVVHPDDRQAIRSALARTIADGAAYEAEYRVLWPDGAVRHLSARGRLVREGAGQTERVNGIVWDVTELRLAEEERQRLQQQLNQAQKMESIGTLAGGIAHDFNNILAAILGYADLAKDDAPPDSHFARDIEHILTAGLRAKDLVKQILAFSRQGSADRILIKIQPLIKEALKMLRASIPSTIEIKEDIHPQCETIVADPTQIHQIMMNLCTNAFHAMEQSGGVLQVRLAMAHIADGDDSAARQLAAGDYVELTVADTGTGIGPDIIDRIFDPYFTTKEFGKGTGMGLSITHGIVKSYGGAITVESTLGQGTAFHVYLPVAVVGQEPEETEETAAMPSGRERILYIDDEDFLAELGASMLERLGYRVTVRQSSFEALELFMNDPEQFDLVITDQTMPGMTGFDLARRMMQIRPDLPVILCTGFSNLIDEESAKAVGIKGFALKPLTKKDLALLIRQVLDGSAARP